MSIKQFVGIDPGYGGGIACIIEQNHYAIKFNGRTESDIVFSVLDVVRSTESCFVMIESVHSMPAQGVSSSFKFGRIFGILLGTLYSSKVPFDFVSPQRWQKELGCMSGGDKNITKTKAQTLFPNIKVTHNIADALLIAEFARRVKSGE